MGDNQSERGGLNYLQSQNEGLQHQRDEFGLTVTLCHADQSLPRSNSDTASREFGSGVEKLLPKEGIAGVVLKLFHPPMSNLRPSLRRTGQKIGLGWNVCYIGRILNLKRLG